MVFGVEDRTVMSKPGRLSRFLPKFFRTENKVKNKEHKGPSCVVVFLDDSEHAFLYKNSWKGQMLFDQVCELISLSEKLYFGLRYVDAAGQTHWLDLLKSVHSQLKGCSRAEPKLYFGVKFYVADPCKLWEEITRYLFFLQIKKDILQGRLPVSFDEAAELSAYALQSELGDFDSRFHTSGYVSEFSFVPNQTEELEARIMGMHRRCLGATPVMAEMKFLEKVKWLEMYGADLHPVQDASHVEHLLGLTPTGIVLYKHKTKIANHFWPRVTKASCKSKHFIIKVKDKNNEEHVYTYELSTKSACKHLWKCCCEHHSFFSERSKRQSTYKPRSRNEPRVNRKPSTRKARRSNSDSRVEVKPHEVYVDSSWAHTPAHTQVETLRTSPHRSLPELHRTRSARSSATPWESNLEQGLYILNPERPDSRPQASYPTGASDTESSIQQRKRYFPGRKESDLDSDASASKRRSDTGSEMSFPHSGRSFGYRSLKAGGISIRNPGSDDTDNKTNGSIPSIHSAPVGEARQRRRRRRHKSPSNLRRPPEEIKQYIEFELKDTEGLTPEQLIDIPYTKVETKADLFRIKYSPKFRDKVWTSRRHSAGNRTPPNGASGSDHQITSNTLNGSAPRGHVNISYSNRSGQNLTYLVDDDENDRQTMARPPSVYSQAHYPSGRESIRSGFKSATAHINRPWHNTLESTSGSFNRRDAFPSGSQSQASSEAERYSARNYDHLSQADWRNGQDLQDVQQRTAARPPTGRDHFSAVSRYPSSRDSPRQSQPSAMTRHFQEASGTYQRSEHSDSQRYQSRATPR